MVCEKWTEWIFDHFCPFWFRWFLKLTGQLAISKILILLPFTI